MIAQGIPSQNSLRFWISKKESENLNAYFESAGNSIKAEKNILIALNGETVGCLFFSNNLLPGTKYNFVLKDAANNLINERLAQTLPESIKSVENGELLVSLGSCYWLFNETAKKQNLQEYNFRRPLFRFLVGDQIYNDRFSRSVVWDSTFTAPDTFNNYRYQWNDNSFQNFYTAAPNAVLADDHEFWDDYPTEKIFQIWSRFANINTKKKIVKDCISGFETYQLPMNPGSQKSFRLDFKELSFFVLDTRLSRDRFTQFTNAEDRSKFYKWITNLLCPGVLVISNSLIDETFSKRNAKLGIDDHTLADYGNDFFFIWEKLAKAKHDILLLTGDAHYNRFGYVDVNQRPGAASGTGKVFECVCSPLSLLNTAGDNFPKEYKKKVFDMSGSLRKNIKLTYSNTFPLDQEFPSEYNSFANINFKSFDGGIKFEVSYYNSVSGKIFKFLNDNNQILY